jgi:hypothetical protein
VTIWRQILAIAVVSLAAASAAATATARHEALLPSRGVLVAGVSLAGVRLGDTPGAVELSWGTNHTSCTDCRLRTWFFVYPNNPVGAAVEFSRRGHAVAVFTLGQPLGWHTQKGLWLGADVHTLTAKYDAPSMAYRDCVGYNALSMSDGDVVTSIYTQAEAVYGFALTKRGQPVCQ